MRICRHLAAVVLTAVALSACSSDATTAPAVDVTTVNFASSLGINLSAMTRTADGLYYQDSPAGTGTNAITGSHVTVNYTGYFTNGAVFDTSIGRSPFGFTVGQGQVIAGWDEGIVGMKVGGTRKLVIPPSLGYGSAGSGPIPPNSILVFTVQLISVP